MNDTKTPPAAPTEKQPPKEFTLDESELDGDDVLAEEMDGAA